jgi:hypothetical protein
VGVDNLRYTANNLLEAAKTGTFVDNGDGVTGPGDTIDYEITITNNGNTIITGLTLNDQFYRSDNDNTNLTDNPTLTLTSGLSFQPAVGGA